jgi:putative ABC transport system substrate-binding protein
MVSINDPVATGLVDSLARPGGNITGLSTLVRELSGKRLELLKEVVPGISRVGLLGEANTAGFKEYEATARALVWEIKGCVDPAHRKPMLVEMEKRR